MLGRRWPRPTSLRKWASLSVSLLLLSSAVLPYFLFHMKPVYANQSAVMRPSKWPVFVGTSGDIEVNVKVPGFAVKIEIPWEFVPVSTENDTSFVWSTITEDYWYYNVTDARQHFPYDPSAPWYVIIWSWNLTGFTPPQIVRFKNMVAPRLAGLYNMTLYVSTSLSTSRRPIFADTPTEVLTILVCGSRDWATVYGYAHDRDNGELIKAKGVVYAFNTATQEREARALINVTTGFFNLTGLRPGTYWFEASAGYFATTGFAYAVTNQTQYGAVLLFERGKMQLNMTVDRGATIRGSIRYHLNDPSRTIIRSLNHPWLVSLGYSAKGILNWTVEAHDSNGKLVAADFGNTLNALNGEDPFVLVIGKGRKYIGADPVGTEFCGIDVGTYNLTAHVFAYVREENTWPPLVVQINQKGQTATMNIDLTTGGVISGTLRFVNPRTQTTLLETPRQAEKRVCETTSGALFGGHILVETYRVLDWSLKGIFVRNGTGAAGTTVYADENTIRFYVLGFNEYYNRTYSGVWRQMDFGLDKGLYSVSVHVRGYMQRTSWNVTLGLGMNQTVLVEAYAGGAIKTTLASGIAWPCTTRFQMYAEWIFFEGPLHYRARIYYYDQRGISVGYTERIIAEGQPDVENVMLTTVFSGMNYDLAEVIFWGEVPTVLLPGTYGLKAFTYGYVQSTWPSIHVGYYCALAQIIMLIGCEVEITGVLIRAAVFYPLVENVSYRADLFNQTGDLVGGQIGNATVGNKRIDFSCRGFGGVGHFFFVTPEGARHYDSGYGKGSFSLFLRRFGYLHRFEQTRVNFDSKCVGSEVGFILTVPLLSKIYGVVYGLSEGVPLRLSWATIDVSELGEASISLDGTYWVFVPEGRSLVYYSLVGYTTAWTPSRITVPSGAEVELDFTLSPAPI